MTELKNMVRSRKNKLKKELNSVESTELLEKGRLKVIKEKIRELELRRVSIQQAIIELENVEQGFNTESEF